MKQVLAACVAVNVVLAIIWSLFECRWLLPFILLAAIALGYTLLCVFAPNGHEDEAGFHYDEEEKR